MEIIRLKVLLPIISIILLGIISLTIVAQTGTSAGCNAWNGLGTVERAPNTRTGITAQSLLAGEVLRVSFTLNSAASATVNLESPSGVPVQQQTFAGGSVSFNFIIPSDGLYSVFGANDGSTIGTVNVTFTCQTPQPNAANILVPEPQGFTDGRINYRDAAAPIVLYPYQDDTGSGFDIYSANGDFLWRVTGADLANPSMFNPTHNINVTRTAGGGYQISAPQYNGKTYILQFDAPLTNIGYSSWEQD